MNSAIESNATAPAVASTDLLRSIAGDAALNGEGPDSETIRMARTLNYLFLQIRIAANGAKEDGADNVEDYLRRIHASAEEMLRNVEVSRDA